VVDRQRPDAGSQADAAGQTPGLADEELGRKRVLAYPCLAIAELVGGDHLEQVFLVRVGDAPSRPVVL
jgi:hypothetical protein